MIDFQGLAAALLARSRDLLPVWLPGGKMQGHEYVCGSLRGETGRSLSINMDTGRWADFSSDAKGGDLISLWAAMEQTTQLKAAEALAKDIGFGLKTDAPRREIAKVKESLIQKPPVKETAPLGTHPTFGKPSHRWCYRDAAGDPLFYIARYDPNGERKQYVPWTWDGTRWGMKSWPEPRPIYGLDLLEARPTAPVIVVEGEKAAEAARVIAGNVYVVVSWPGGSSAWQKVDWTKLSGRKVLLWPDADRHVAKKEDEAKKAGVELGGILPMEFQPGYKAMASIGATICGYAQEVKIIDPRIDTERPDGWDAADALAGGWGFPQLVAWAKPNVAVIPPPAEAQVMERQQADVEINVHVDAADESGPPVPHSLYAEWEKLGIATAANGNAICNFDNALRVLEGRPEFRDLIWFDEFHKRCFTRFDFSTWRNEEVREWGEIDELNMMAFMQRQLGLRRIGDEMVRKAAMTYAHRNTKNEPRDWMDTLKWDGVERCAKFLVNCYGAAETDYELAASMNFWIGLAARVYRPGCQLDNMIVLEGIQGGFKTTSLKLIGGAWYTNVREAVTSKDFFMILNGRLIIEIAELDSFGKAEVTKIKEVVTTATDRYRAPYERAVADHPRSSVFIGTTNEDQYLRDNTGARRFWPIKCKRIDKDRIIAERTQLFAEAVHRFKEGEQWWVMPASALEHQEARRQRDAWEDIVESFLKGADRTTSEKIAYHLKIEARDFDLQTQRRISNVMRALKWVKRRGRMEGELKYIWTRNEEVEADDKSAIQEIAPF